MIAMRDPGLLMPSRRNLFRLAGAGALTLGSTAVLSACTKPAPAEAAEAPAIDPDAIAIMSSNENPYGPSPKAVQAMMAELGNVNRYAGVPLEHFTNMIAEREGVAVEQVLVTNGSNPLLVAFADWVKVKGGKLVTSATTYETVVRVSNHVGTEIVQIPLDADFQYDLEAIAAAVGPDTGGVYICNPNNPTGRLLDPARLKAFVDEVSLKAPVFLDEAYLDLADNYTDSVMSGFVAAGRNVIVARTFSKLYGMAGQRLGYALMPAEMVTDINRTGRISSVNHLGLIAGIASLDDKEYFEDMRVRTALARQKLVNMAADVGRPIMPDPQGSFIYMDVGMPSGEFSAKMLEKGVRVQGGRRWPERPNWSRICVGLDHEIEKCHAAAKEILTPV